MIKGRKNSENIIRPRQAYDTRLNKVRLGMNEKYPSMPKELFQEIMSGFTIEEASAYPEMKTVYDAMSKFLGQPIKRILLSSGADMAIKITLESICEKGDQLLTCAPTYAMYTVYAKMLECKLNSILPDEYGNFNINDLIAGAKDDIRAVILANPNGITGFYFTYDEIRKLLTELPETPIIIDEAYADFAGLDVVPLLDEFSNLIVIRSFSKNIGFTGLQVGYILARESVIEFIEKFKPGTEINSLAARAVKVLCSKPELIKAQVAETIQVRKFFANSLKELGFKVIENGGNFVLVDFGHKTVSVRETLDNANVEYKMVTKPFDGHIRFAIGDMQTMATVLEIIKNAD